MKTRYVRFVGTDQYIPRPIGLNGQQIGVSDSVCPLVLGDHILLRSTCKGLALCSQRRLGQKERETPGTVPGVPPADADGGYRQKPKAMPTRTPSSPKALASA